MAKPPKPTHSGSREWLKYVLAGMGIPVALSIVLAQMKPDRDELMKRQLEKAFALPRGLMEDEQRINESVEHTRKMTEADWNRNVEAYRTGNKVAKTLSLMTIDFLKDKNPHPAESKALALEFLHSYPVGDWHPAILVLKAIGDSEWQTYNAQGLASSDPGIQQSYQFFDTNVLKLDQADKPAGSKQP